MGAIGHEGTSFSDLHGLSYKSWDYIDVDSDVEMIRNCQVVVGQESGLAYLTMLCEKPLFIIDIAHKDVADEHRNESVPYIQLLGKPLAERVKLIKSHCQP